MKISKVINKLIRWIKLRLDIYKLERRIYQLSKLCALEKCQSADLWNDYYNTCQELDNKMYELEHL